MDVIRYAGFCGPQALGAVVGVPATDAAAVLLVAARGFGIVSDGKGTSRALIDFVLSNVYGRTVEPWDPRVGKGPICPPEEWTEMVTKDLFDMGQGLEPPAPPARPPQGRHRRVREWTAPGTWLLSVEGHLMAVQDGEIVAGRDEGQYDDVPVTSAARITTNPE